jgi:DNA-binding NtrC family response regulator
MTDSTALLISPDPALSDTLAEISANIQGLRLEVVAGIQAAMARLRYGGLGVILIHLREQGETAEVSDLLAKKEAAARAVPVVVLSDQPHPRQELALLQQGVADYLVRPLDTRRLAYLMEVLTVKTRLAGGISQAPPRLADLKRLGDRDPFFYGPDGAMAKVMEQVQQVAPQDTTILLAGETGTGKTRLARLIHELSARRGGPFLTVNCGALSANLIDSEMFGHVKGAFTGADRERTGKFAEAGRGTLLLDEVDALSLDLQAKLLHVIEERVFHQVGSNKALPFQARLIVASNRMIETEVGAGRFRSDLYYRLAVVAFYLPALRERLSLIPTLVGHFIAEFSRRSARMVHGIAAEALQALEDHVWPGNIRELRNVIERAVALCAGPEIQRHDLPATLVRPPRTNELPASREAVVSVRLHAAQPTLHKTKEEAESYRIRQALASNRNNRLRAAAELGVSRMTLYKKLHKYGLI